MNRTYPVEVEKEEFGSFISSRKEKIKTRSVNFTTPSMVEYYELGRLIADKRYSYGSVGDNLYSPEVYRIYR